MAKAMPRLIHAGFHHIQLEAARIGIKDFAGADFWEMFRGFEK
ncbi:MAG: hypothetical protein N3D11_11315 [Candidatus Sumerlaeia bacterium]|nr:hypothetical protein [Candidatus Sumerlaeia bacterium]